MKEKFLKFIRDEEGLTMVEYAIAGSLVGVACVLAFSQLGDAVAAAIGKMITVITTGAPAP
jgi:pilus assembly protein Flp/PilA